MVEADLVPTSYVPAWYFTPKHDGQTETLGERIMEMPDDKEALVDRDSRVTFTAYVPRGAALVAGQDAERVPACATCHGEGLHGIGSFPPLAGPMQDNVANMTQSDMIAVAAYIASLDP